MLIYEKKVIENDEEVRHLFGTINNVPSDSDNQLVYQDADGDSITPSLNYSFLDNGEGGIDMIDPDGNKTFLAVNIKKSDNLLVNIVPGGNYEPEEKVLVSIRFKRKPTKTEYVEGETISTTGAVIEATWESGETSTVTSDCTFTPNGALATTDTAMVASYTYPESGDNQVTKTASYTITVVANNSNSDS